MASELGKAYVQIIPSAKGISGELRKIVSDEAGPAGIAGGTSMMSSLKSTIIKGVSALGIGKIIGTAFSEGANLEQSLGGIETLFDTKFSKASEIVKKNASEAFKTVGMSANSYMENVTSFSAGLIASVGGDTKKAADIANMAMIDMGDNANKMGSSLESIQNAYQGFARGNYTMLDNLKLGFAGTKEEMQRLLAEAEKISGVHYDISNLSDVYEAIHVIQGELNITGTTAEEAATTFTGSFNMMKSAFTDLLGNIALGQNIDQSLNNLLESVKTFVFGNLLPMAKTMAESVFNIVCESLNNLAPGLGDGLRSALESIQTALSTIWTSIEGIFSTGIIQTVLTTLGTIISGIFTSVQTFFDSGIMQTLFQTLSDAITNIITIIQGIIESGIIENALSIISTAIEGIITVIQGIIDSGLIENALTIIGDILTTIGQVITDIASSEFIQTGIQLLSDIISGISTALSEVVKWVGDLNDKFNLLEPIITAVVSAFLSFQTAMAISSVVTTLGSAFTKFTGILGTVKTAVSGLFTLIMAHPFIAIGAAVAALVVLVIKHWGEIKKVIENVWNKIKETFENIGKAIADAWNTVKTKTEEVWNGLCTFIQDIIGKITGFFTGLVDGMFNIGKNILEGLWNGIKSAADWVTKKVKGVVDGIVGGIKGFLGIHSPSTVFAGIGENTMLGLAKGVEDNISPVERAMNSVEDAMGNDFTKKISFASSGLDAYDFSSDEASEAKPMAINLSIGGKSFKAFVESISNEQDKTIDLELAY